MWYYFFMALGLAFVLEGLFPFINPDSWQKIMLILSKRPPAFLRRMGFIVMLIGVLVLFITHSLLGQFYPDGLCT